MKNLRAFTLIEIIVTIVILGVLAGIAFPQYQKVMVSIEEKNLKIDLNILNAAAVMYKEKYGKPYTPAGALCTTSGSTCFSCLVWDINSSTCDLNGFLKTDIPTDVNHVFGYNTDGFTHEFSVRLLKNSDIIFQLELSEGSSEVCCTWSSTRPCPTALSCS